MAALRQPAAWYGRDMVKRRDEWLIRFSEADIAELQRAGEHCLRQGLGLDDLTADTFALDGLIPKLQGIIREIVSGRGFCVLRGLPVAHWDAELTALIYWGLGLHLGKPGAQNPQGEKLGHVKDYGEGPGMQRLYRTAQDIGFHCDGAQAVGLLCLRAARSGGDSRIASSVTVFNELLKSDPTLAARLFEPIYLDRRDEQPAGAAPCSAIQPSCYDPPFLRTFYHSEYFRSAARHPGYAPDAVTLELLDRYDQIAHTPGICLDMQLQPGDIQLLSNYTVIHARTAYQDHAAPAEQRHLLRLWLNFPD